MDEETIQFTPDNDNNTITVNVTNELSLNNVEEFQQELLSVFHDYEQFNIQLKDIEIFDLAGIQILQGLKNSAEKAGKKVQLDIQLTDELIQIVQRAGFNEFA